METAAKWMMNEYGVINSLDVFCLLVISFFLLYFVAKITENLIWPVVAFFLVIVAIIFTVYITAKSDIFLGDNLASPEQKQKLYLCLEDYKKQNPAAQVDSSIINDAVYFCSQKKKIEEDRRKIESWK